MSDTYIHTYIDTKDNFHPFFNPYIEISIKGGAFWDHKVFLDLSLNCALG